MDPPRTPPLPSGWLDRLRQSWFPPAAVVGAFAAFTAAALRGRASRNAIAVRTGPAPAPRQTEQPVVSTLSTRRLEREYVQTAVLPRALSPHVFRRFLAGIAVGSRDQIWTLADDEVSAFEADGAFIRSWKLSQRAACLSIGPDGRVYVGSRGRVDIYDERGHPVGGFPAGDPAKPAFVSCIRVFGDEILVGDTGVRFIRRYTPSGREVGEIGAQAKTGGFMLPNGFLDFAVDQQGVVYAADSGRHQVTSWTLDGSPRGRFGRFGQHNLEDFSGCCNPVNIALTPDGKVVTGEKATARVKVYEPDGALLAAIGTEHFDARCTHLFLAVDSTGRILVADPVRGEVKVFSRV
jgi:hypothetical protein